MSSTGTPNYLSLDEFPHRTGWAAAFPVRLGKESEPATSGHERGLHLDGPKEPSYHQTKKGGKQGRFG
jgi:hypothetical protein